jgi:hypothetical protein
MRPKANQRAAAKALVDQLIVNGVAGDAEQDSRGLARARRVRRWPFRLNR